MKHLMVIFVLGLSLSASAQKGQYEVYLGFTVSNSADLDWEIFGDGFSEDVESGYGFQLEGRYFATKRFSFSASYAQTEGDLRLWRNPFFGERTDLFDGKLKGSYASLLVQYHFIRDFWIDPYIGAGIGFVNVKGDSNRTPGVTLQQDLDFDSDVSLALNTGASVRLSGAWRLNLDIRHLFAEPETNDLGRFGDELDLNPLLYTLSAGYRF